MFNKMNDIIENLDEKGMLIINMARREFAANGFYNANMDKIAQDADVGKGTLYRRFVSKQILFFVTLDVGFSNFMEKIKQINMDANLEEQINQYLEVSSKFFIKNSDLIRLFMHEQSKIMEGVGEEVQPWVEKYHRNPTTFWTQVVDQLKTQGKLAKDIDTNETATIISNMLRALYSDLLMLRLQYDEEKLKKRNDYFKKILMGGILNV